MLLRIKALLRRVQIANERKLRIGQVILDYDALTVTKDGCAQTLPKKEFYLLYKLLSYPDKIFTRLQLMDEIWGMERGLQCEDQSEIARRAKRIKREV